LVSNLKGAGAGTPGADPQSVNGGAGLEERWAAPIGVAAASAGGPFALDFLADDLAAGRSSRSTFAHAGATCLLAIIAFSAYFGGRAMEYQRNTERIDAVGQQVWDVLVEIFPEADAAERRPLGDIGGFKSLEALRDAQEDEQKAGQSFNMATYSKPTFLEVLKELATHMPDSKVSLTRIAIGGVRTTQITIMGEVRTDADFAQVLEGMQSSLLFHVGEDGAARQSNGGKQTFTIVATL
jgi:hypothetical protein